MKASREPDDIVFIYVTFPDPPTAEKICRELIGVRVIACANILAPMKSIFWWKDTIETGSEIPTLLKTTAELYPQAREKIQSLHPYQVPCIVELPTDRIHPAYAEWLTSELRGQT